MIDDITAEVQAIFEEVRDVVAEVLKVEPAEVTIDARLREDLGADMYALGELAFQLEGRLNLGPVSDKEALKFETVNHAVRFVLDRRRATTRYIAFWGYDFDQSRNCTVMEFEAASPEEASEKVLREQGRTSIGGAETIFVTSIGDGRLDLTESLRELLRSKEVTLRLRQLGPSQVRLGRKR